LAFAGLLSYLEWRNRRLAAAALLPLAVSSVYFGLSTKSPSITVVRPDFLDLHNNAELRKEKIVNLALGNIHLNSMAALIIPTQRVVVTQATYAPKTKPEGNVFLVPSNFAAKSGVISLNSSYALVMRNFVDAGGLALPATGEPILLSTVELGEQEGWHEPEPWGTWLHNKATLAIKLNPPPTSDVLVKLQTIAVVGPRVPYRTLKVTCSGAPCGEFKYSLEKPTMELALRIPFAAITDGLMRLQFDVSPQGSPASIGVNEDLRPIGIGITSVEISKAERQ
jgi:hypothetical protein